MLYDVDLEFRKKVLEKFQELRADLLERKCGFSDGIRIFYNVDTRILEMTEYKPGNTKIIMDGMSLELSVLCFEISERRQVKSYSSLRNILTIYKQQGYCVALDDFGVGFSGFELMYHSEPNIIKIDKHYIKGISTDKKKKLYVAQMTKMAHVEGALVVAKGVETEEDLMVVQQLGCDYVQGFLISKPTTKVKELEHAYIFPIKCQVDQNKQSGTDADLLLRNVENREPMLNTTYVRELLKRFKEQEEITTIPVVDKFNRPVGVIEERKMKKYVYSMYGKEIVEKHPLSRYVSSAPIVDVHQSIEDIIQAFATCSDIDGMLLTRNGEYVGYLSARLLVETIHLKNMESAREENPLTKLPGNNSIASFITDGLGKNSHYRLFTYLDLDNFKPFNDRFGFKVGDKAIAMMADLLKDYAKESGAFIGHIGGDDFFAGVVTADKGKIKSAQRDLWELVDSFGFAVKAFYDKDERKKGSYCAKDRFGEDRCFALLGASIAIVKIGIGSNLTQEELGEMFSKLKKESKSIESHVAVSDIDYHNSL
jgi:diguanylate cyclase (GGDEF)-like protein